jgi:hypothetical protein
MRNVCWLLFTAPLAAHMVSMSTGELKVAGNHGHYELFMPMYEVAHVSDPAKTLLQHVRFKGGGGWGKASNESCREDQATYVCVADYEFPGPVEEIEAECTLASVTVPNHVHLLHAYLGDKVDQAVFDLSFTDTMIRFRPPTPFEIAFEEIAAGFMRAVGGLAPLLFLTALVLAARSWRELAALTGAFLIAESLACLLEPRIRFPLSPRFIEAAAALTIAYLAFEIVLLPNSSFRWLVVGVLGLFHGTYFSMFLAQSGYHATPFLAGVAMAELLLIIVMMVIVTRLARFAWMRRVVPVAASLLLTIGVVWFFLRLRA